MNKILTFVGVKEKLNKKKLILKPNEVTTKVPTGINHHTCLHSMSMQRSKYVCIDDNIDKQFVLNHETKRQTLFK